MKHFVFLHGFWGCGQDWDLLLEELHSKWGIQSPQCWCPDLLSHETSLGPEKKPWAEAFLAELERRQIRKPLLIGYSLGGRLALQTALRFSNTFSGLVLISVNPALEDFDRQERKRSDLHWAKRFRHDSWSALVKSWNDQPVLRTSQPMAPLEAHFSRERLAEALESWSVADQWISREELLKLEIPLLWLAGERDEKFKNILTSLKSLGVPGRFLVVPSAGHRVPQDNPSGLSLQILDFTKEFDLLPA